MGQAVFHHHIYSLWEFFMSELSFDLQLKQNNLIAWNRAIEHRFVEELFKGNIEDSVFAEYLIQDYQFLDAFLVLMGAAVANVDNLDSRLILSRQLALVASDENTYFIRAFDELNVNQQNRIVPKRSKATENFNQLMLQTAKLNDYGRILTLLLVAEWLYLEWAQRANSKLPTRYIHSEWIVIHDNPQFVKWVDFLRAEINRIGKNYDYDTLNQVFATAVKLENDFFDACYS